VRRAFEVAERVLTEHHDRLILISEKLIQTETLEGPEFEELFTMPLPPDGVAPSLRLPAAAQTALPATVAARYAIDGEQRATSEPDAANGAGPTRS
jgi:hypothetical protein